MSKYLRVIVAAGCSFSHLFFLDAAAAAAPQEVAPWTAHLQAGRAAIHEARFLDALEHYYAAQKLAEQAPHSAELKGQILSSIGACLLGLSDYQGALAKMLEARPHTVAGGNRDHLAALDANIATAYVYQGEYESAAQIYRRALAAIVNDPQSEKRPPILANLGVIELRRKRLAQAFGHLRRALEAARAVGFRKVEADVEDLLGLAYLGLRDYPNAEAAFRRGLEVRRSIPPTPNLSCSLMLLGRTAWEAGQPLRAAEFLDQALERARERDDAATLRSVLYYRGRVRRDLGQTAAAAGDFRAAVEVLESVRLRLVPTDALRVQFEVTYHEAYAALAETLLELAGGGAHGAAVAEAFHAVEMGRARSLRALVEERQREPVNGAAGAPGPWTRYADRLARIEVTRSRLAAADSVAAARWREQLAEQEAKLRDFEARLRVEDPWSASPALSPALGLREVQEQVLDPDSLLLNFYSGASGLALWAVTRSEARFYRLPAAGHLVGRFLRALEAGAAGRGALGRRLYQALLGAVDRALLDRPHWIIAADGVLGSLPFCALPAPGGTRYLVEDHSFSYTPSASALAGLARPGSRTYQYDFLGVADPVLNRADERWPSPPAAGEAERLARLAASRQEVAACARLFSPQRSRVLAGFDASEAALRRLARDPHRYWHFSSHVVVDAESPNQSFVALSMPRAGVRAEKLTVLKVLRLPIDAEMVFLSGCESGTGRELPGAGVLGLARAFLAAGARSVCVTRWKIPDERGELARRFYTHLLRGGPSPAARAQALRRAQIEMIRAADWRSEPRYWAAYFLVGSAGEPAAPRLTAPQ